MRHTGESYGLTAGAYAAAVTEGGARLRSLMHDGRPLVAGFEPEQLPPVYRGAVLAPWPNRIADGRYTFAGTTHQLPINEPDRMTALHGLVAWDPWRAAELTSSSVTLEHRLWPRDGYPFMLDLAIGYFLDADGLRIALTARNSGDRTAPYGCSIHPYLVAGPGQVDGWTLTLPAGKYLEVDGARLLPTAVRDVDGSGLDFRLTQRIGDRFVDHAFTDLDFALDRTARVQLRHSDGRGVEMIWDDACHWVQVHTADRPEAQLHRSGLAVEPMTCPPNAFQTGEGLVELPPGGAITVQWRIRAIS